MRPSSVLLLSVLSSSHSVLASCARGTTLHPRQEAAGGETIELPDFDYGTTRGPVNWHGISPEYSLCATGKHQSPINIDESIALEAPGFVNMHVPVQHNVPFENLGTNVEVVLSGSTVIGAETFELKQFHFHTPSEHRIFGEQYPIEIHMVHESPGNPGKIAVVATVIQIVQGSTLSPLDTLISHVNEIHTPGNITHVPTLDLAQMVDTVNSLQFFNYQGSLTTPPCTEGLTFLLSAQAIQLQVGTFNALKAVVGSNNRHIQGPLGEENVIIAAANSLASIQPGAQQVVNQCQDHVNQAPAQSSPPAAVQDQHEPANTPAPDALQNQADGAAGHVAYDEGNDNQQAENAADQYVDKNQDNQQADPAAAENQDNQQADDGADGQGEGNQQAENAADQNAGENQGNGENQDNGENQNNQPAKGAANAAADGQGEGNQQNGDGAGPKAAENQDNQPDNGAEGPAMNQNQQNQQDGGGDGENASPDGAQNQDNQNQPAKDAANPDDTQNPLGQPAGENSPENAQPLLKKYFFA